ncbi:MAG: peptidoglycan domain protein, partial [Campylobacter concisus]|nr:peptidoglycan domain protein [Campylobacter concisus]
AINKVDEEKFDKEFDRAELEYYNMLIKQNPKLRVYANGWRRRAEAV